MNRLLKHLGRRPGKLKESSNSFRFADSVYDSHKAISLSMRTTANEETIMIEMDVVSANVPAITGLDAMDYNCITPCKVTNSLIKHMVQNGKPADLWRVNLIRADSNHLFASLQMPSITWFSRVQLNKLHRQFFHPSPDKLFNLFKRAHPDHTTSETRKACLLYTSPSPRDLSTSRMPSSA